MTLAPALGLGMLAVLPAQALEIQFDPINGQLPLKITDAGTVATFTFAPGYDFYVYSDLGGAGTLSTLDSVQVSGSFTVARSVGGGMASLAGQTLQLSIWDHTGPVGGPDLGDLHHLTATIDLTSISETGSSGALQIGDLSNVIYHGVNQDLQTFAAEPPQTFSFAWTLNSSLTLNQLVNDNGKKIGPNGDLNTAVPDGGLTIGMLGFALVGAAGMRRKLGK